MAQSIIKQLLLYSDPHFAWGLLGALFMVFNEVIIGSVALVTQLLPITTESQSSVFVYGLVMTSRCIPWCLDTFSWL